MGAIADRLHPRLAKELRRKTRLISNSVGVIHVIDGDGGGHTGTCILLTPHLLVTCRHVLRTMEEARAARVTLYTSKSARAPYAATTGRLQPDVLFLNSAEEDDVRRRAGEETLDFALAAFILDPPSPIKLTPGVESILAARTWQTDRPIMQVQVAGVHTAKSALEVFPPGQMLHFGPGRQGDWAYPLKYRASTVESYSGGAVLTLALTLLAIHVGYTDECNYGCPIQAVLHCAAAVWERQQREGGQGIHGVGRPAQKDFIRLVRAQGIDLNPWCSSGISGGPPASPTVSTVPPPRRREKKEVMEVTRALAVAVER